MPAHRYVEENGSDARLAARRLAGVTPEVNIREHVTFMPQPSANKAAQGTQEVQNRGISGPQKGHMSSNFFFQKSVCCGIGQNDTIDKNRINSSSHLVIKRS